MLRAAHVLTSSPRRNKKQGRKIPKDELETDRWLVHRTVKMRLEWNSKYQPRVRPNLKSGKTIVVDDEKKELRVALQLDRAEWNVAQSEHFDWVPRVMPTMTEQPIASL